MRKTGCCLLLLFLTLALYACTSYQTTKNVWKGTKGLWATYVSPPAYVDYDDKGELAPQKQSLTTAMIGVDQQLSRLERLMQNADRPPTREWMERLFENFPWVSGFAGVKYDGSILGQEPAESLKNLDFNYLLHEDYKQRSRALRADVQPSELGPEVMIAAPLYDGIDFLGLVVVYFDFRHLISYSEHPEDIVVLTPTALLWPGKYDFASTPLAGVEWGKVVKESSAGTCSNANGTFFYLVRYFANLPLVFAVPEKGDFQNGDGSIEQGFAFFPKEREKGAPPPVSEERLKKEAMAKEIPFGQSENPEESVPETPAQASVDEPGPSPNDLAAGSHNSVLLKKPSPPRRQIEERTLEGENVQVERVRRRPRRAQPAVEEPALGLLPEPESESPAIQRPSPFGPPREENAQEIKRPSPFGPPAESGAAPQAAESSRPEETVSTPPAAAEPAKEQNVEPTPDIETPEQRRPALLPGGRPSPFGPR